MTISLITLLVLKFLLMELPKKCLSDWCFPKLKPIVFQKHELQCSGICVSRRFSTGKVLLDCSTLCLSAWNENLIRGSCQFFFLRAVLINLPDWIAEQSSRILVSWSQTTNFYRQKFDWWWCSSKPSLPRKHQGPIFPKCGNGPFFPEKNLFF